MIRKSPKKHKETIGEKIRSGLVYPIAMLQSPRYKRKDMIIAVDELFKVAELSWKYNRCTRWQKRKLQTNYLDKKFKSKIKKLSQFAKEINLFERKV